MKRFLVKILVLTSLIVFVQGTAMAQAFKEAPALAEQVKAGKLPPVAKRLPDVPMVVKSETVGQYGGTWRMGMTAGTDDPSFFKVLAYEPLVRFNTDWSDIVPNVAEKWTANDSATEYTFTIRKGLKWSDGELYTVDDILFWWNDVELNTELAPSPPSWMMVNGKPGTVTKVSDQVVKFSFSAPYGLFLQQMASANGRSMNNFPAHWAKQFHKKYADGAKLDAMMKEGGFSNWRDFFNAKVSQADGGGYGQYNVAGRPTIYAWMVEQPTSGSATQVVFTRNPYYWKVDQAGQQYPYIDKVVYTIYQDVAAMLLKAANGEIDFQMRHFNTIANKPVLYDNMAKGGYHFVDLLGTTSNAMVIMLNLTSKDALKRQVFQDKNFRIGMSYAIDRQEIIDTVYVGQGTPFQPAPFEGTPFYNKQLATQYTEYDIVKAKQYLDKAGMGKKDKQGWRLGPDGKPFSFVVEASNATPEMVDALNMVIRYWKAVGINCEAKPEDRALLYTRKNANDIDGMVFEGAGGLGPILDPRNFFPQNSSGESAYAVPWSYWYNGVRDNTAEEPPAEVKKIMAAFDKVIVTPTFDGQVKAMNEMLQLSADYFFCMGITQPPMSYGIAKNNMKNTPLKSVNSFTFPTPATLNTFAFYFAK
jgi:peptide/nickel transport system substrate-binding protein